MAHYRERKNPCPIAQGRQILLLGKWKGKYGGLVGE